MEISETFLEGNRRRYTATFALLDDDGNPTPTDPTEIFFYRRQLPSSLETLETYQYGVDDVTKVDVGIYQVELSYPDDGRFVVAARGTDACEAYTEMRVLVANAEAVP